MGRPKKSKSQVRSPAASAARSLEVVYPEGQKYSCRDCPARCCTSPWGIPVTPEEYERIVSDEEARSRLGQRGEAVLRAGVLPMNEVDGRLSCVFLDDDQLCSLHRKHGHTFIPAPCQAYPFGFQENEDGAPVALLSRYCPSIRDDYGEPVDDLLKEKLEQAGGAHPMAPKMGLRSGRTVAKEHVGSVAEAWRTVLARAPNPAEGLSQILDLTESFDAALPPRKELSSTDVAEALSRCSESSPPLTRGRTPFNARVFYAYLLGGLSYPTRVLLAHRTKAISFWERTLSFVNRAAWLFGIGKVRLYLVERPVPVGAIERVHPFLAEELGSLVRDYLREILLRRQGMGKQTYLARVLVDLGLMTILVSRFARARAASEGRSLVDESDVREGIGIAELLFSHQGDGGQGQMLHSLRLKLMGDPADFRRLLSSEL